MSWLRHIRYVIVENPISLVAAGILAVLLVTALVGPVLVPHDPLLTNAQHPLQPPSMAHWFGTDQLGRDLFSRVVVATRLDLTIAASAVALSFVFGTMLGGACGYFGGALDRTFGRMVDVVMAFPLFVLAMAMVAALGNTVTNIVYATAIINIPFYFRIARTEVNVRRNIAYVEAARLAGNGDGRILMEFLLPNVLPPLMVQISLNMGWAILNAAGLSFIGLGIRPPTPEWGIMVADGAVFALSGEWWVPFFPGCALILAVFGFNILGDALRDIVDSRRRT